MLNEGIDSITKRVRLNEEGDCSHLSIHPEPTQIAVNRTEGDTLSSSQHRTLNCRSFWRAGSDEAFCNPCYSPEEKLEEHGFERARVHPKFLHSNATAHKWAFGAIAELLDNAIDEIPNGATFAKVDRVVNIRDSSPALLFQDDGGGMDPEGIRQCMSLGFSSKKSSKTIGQYGNGFKTSTMRLGADVIVFSRANHGSCATQSIGLLSYTYLMKTMKNDVIVPIIDFEICQDSAVPLVNGFSDDWNDNLKIILDWSPFPSMDDLMTQFNDLGNHGTKILVYNLWYDDDGLLELDFTDDNDIKLRKSADGGSSSSAKPAKLNPQSKQAVIESHISNIFQYSLRAYASILYRRKFTNFSIVIRGSPVQQKDITDELKFAKTIQYRPYIGKDAATEVVIGFTKEAPVLGMYGINVYHRNRLIMPFWKVFHENSVRGKCVIGVLEANFMEPAHDKQDFERTPLYHRLQTKLKQAVFEYWSGHCHLIGYQSPCIAVRNYHEKQQQSHTTCSSSTKAVAVQQAGRQDEAMQNGLVAESADGDLNKSSMEHVPMHQHQNEPMTSVSVAGLSSANGSVNLSGGHIQRDGSFAGVDYVSSLQSTSIEIISEENIKLFMKREEYKDKVVELRQLSNKLEQQLAEIKNKCANLASELETRRKNQISGH